MKLGSNPHALGKFIPSGQPKQLLCWPVERAIFKKQRAKAPNEMEMHQRQGSAWVVAAQSIIRL
eukprot:7218817-Karenia_brevis.AAC.1